MTCRAHTLVNFCGWSGGGGRGVTAKTKSYNASVIDEMKGNILSGLNST